MTTKRSRAAALLLALLLAACPGRSNDPARDGHEGHDHGAGEEGHADEVKLSAEAVKSAGIRVDRVARVALVPSLRAPARVALDLDATAHVGVPVRGRVRELRVKRGDRVEKDAVLFLLDSPELGSAQLELLEKRVAAETVAPSVEISKSAFERAKKLQAAGGNITLTEVQRRESEWRTAEANAITSRAAATSAENSLHLLGMDQAAVERFVASREIDATVVVRAPIAGTVIERHVTLGELVSPDQESLLVLADTNVVWVFAHVPETRLGEVRPGSAVRLHAAAFPDRVFEARVSAAPPRIDEATRTAEVRVDVTDAKGLRPGMYAQADLEMGDAKPPVLAIPETAVQTVEGGPAVFVPVPDEENTFAKRALRVGAAIGGMVPVLEGLAEGDAYVAEGSFLLKAELGKASAEHEH